MGKEQITQELIAYAREMAGDYYPSYLSGMLFAILTDEQWKYLENKVLKDVLL